MASPGLGISWSDVVALIGAAAWAPQIWKFLQRPRVTPIVGGQVEIGFTEFGPIFNPKIALRGETRDALVTGLTFVVTHERGQTATFKATMLVEIGAQSENTSGQKFFQQRINEVVAIVLTPTSIAERKLQSREIECLSEWERLNKSVGTAVSRLRGTGPDWVDQVMHSPEFRAREDFTSQRFFWQRGNYKAECQVAVQGQSKPSTTTFRFMLSTSSIELLNLNRQVRLETARGAFAALQPVPADPDQPPPPLKQSPQFHWVYPTVLSDP